MISDQNTMPISSLLDLRPSFQQFREHYGLSRYEVAVEANVRVLFVYCMERGGVIEQTHVQSLMKVLSKYAGYPVRTEHLRGIRLKNTGLQNELFGLRKK